MVHAADNVTSLLCLGDEQTVGSVCLWCFGKCCSLRCMLRPLVVLALIEAVYAAKTVDDEFRRRFDHAKGMTRQSYRVLVDEGGMGPEGSEAFELFDAMGPAQVLEMAQQQLGEVVQVRAVWRRA